MNKPTLVGLGALCLVFAPGCASKEKRFDAILPGMSTSEVQNAMKGGPSRFEQIPQSEYSAWYWGQDERCVLFKNGKVVAKNTAHAGRSAETRGLAYEESSRAQCLAPGQVSETATERTINIPGVGKVRLPERKLREPAEGGASVRE